MRLRIAVVSMVLLSLSGCFAEPREVPALPLGEGMKEFSDWWQGQEPTTSSSPPVGATGLAKSQSTPSPSPSPTDAPAPAETQSAEVPQAVPPPPLETIEGVQEVYYVSFPSQCYQIETKLQAQGLRLELQPIRRVNFPGRSGRTRRRTRRLSSKRGSYYACVFEGPDAVANRYGVNDDYIDAGVDVPDHDVTRHPNDYRYPDPVESPDPANPNRRTVPDPDPNRLQTPNPYDELPY